MSLSILNQPATPAPATSVGPEIGRPTALLGWAIRAIDDGARILIYPAGRNARLAVMDLVEQGALGGRRIVGYADDDPPSQSDDCLELQPAIAKWKPTHVLICARDPALQERLAQKVRTEAPQVATVRSRAPFVEGLAPTSGPPSRPRTLEDLKTATIVMCKTCNIRCSFCYQSDFSQRMDPVIFNEKLRPVYPHISTLDLVGGEVTAYRHAFGFIERIADEFPHIQLQLTTNGILFDERWAEVFCRTGGGVYNSIVAPTQETYLRVAGQDKLEDVIHNIRRTVKLREETGANLEVHISMVITPDTQHELETLVALGEALKVDQVSVGVDTMAVGELDAKLIAGQVQRIESRGPAVKVHWDRVQMVYPDLATPQAVTGPCTKPADTLFVEANGSVFVCCHSHVCLGSLWEDDIETIWKSRAGAAVEADVSTGACASCPQDCIYRPPTIAARRQISTASSCI